MRDSFELASRCNNAHKRWESRWGKIFFFWPNQSAPSYVSYLEDRRYMFRDDNRQIYISILNWIKRQGWRSCLNQIEQFDCFFFIISQREKWNFLTLYDYRWLGYNNINPLDYFLFSIFFTKKTTLLEICESPVTNNIIRKTVPLGMHVKSSIVLFLFLFDSYDDNKKETRDNDIWCLFLLVDLMLHDQRLWLPKRPITRRHGACSIH